MVHYLLQNFVLASNELVHTDPVNWDKIPKSNSKMGIEKNYYIYL